MDNKVLGKALSIIGGIMSVIWGIRELLILCAEKTTGNGEPMRVWNGDSIWMSEYQELLSNNTTVFLIGLGILAFGLLLIYLTKSKEAPKEDN